MMPRRPRVEYPGAIYHVMCRGNRQDPIFKNDADRRSLLKALGQTCERAGWIIHSYVLMLNHYHFLLETLRSTLVEGMKWFHTTYTVRFNLRHKLCGHLFQGRYKALIIDPDEPDYFRRVSDYIHLNPARAQLLDFNNPDLESYLWSSYPAFIGMVQQPVWLDSKRVLKSHGLEPKAYRQFRFYMRKRTLEALNLDYALQEECESIRRGWYLGSANFKKRLLERVDGAIDGKKRESYSGPAARSHDEKSALILLKQGLESLETSLDEIRNRKTTDRQKQGLVWLIRTCTMVKSDWISARLKMGHRSNISRAIRVYEKGSDPIVKEIKEKMLQCKD